MLKQAILLMFVMQACGGLKPENNLMKTTCDTLSMIPPAQGKPLQYGLAGAVTGCDDNRIIVAGGSNFEDNLPWKGGTKMYHDDIFILTLKADGSGVWSQSAQKLPKPMAYSANVPAAKGFISIGGEDLSGKLDLVFQVSIEDDSVQFKALPELPIALSNAGAVQIQSTLYVAGGLDQEGASDCMLSIDLSAENPKWTTLANLPEKLSHAVVAGQSDGTEDCVYVIGGRNKTGLTSTFLSNIWKYSPSSNQWTKAGLLKLNNEPGFGLSAGTGVSFGDRWILLFGGDKGIIFNQTETLNDLLAHTPEGIEKDKLLKEKDELLSNHPGFYKDILAYNTRSSELVKIGEIPGKTQVTTSAFWWNNQVIIPSGEILPGRRTPEITRIQLVQEK